MKRFYLQAVILLVVNCLIARGSDQAVVIPVNFTSFTHQPKVVSEELLQNATESVRSNPDFGKLPVTAPCKDCYEDLSKRKSDTRSFIGNGSNGTHFFTQQSFGAINYLDAAGHWREINPFLQAPQIAGEFHAPSQPFPVTVDLNKRLTSITNGAYSFEFNKSMELFHLDSKGSVTSLGIPDWSHYYAGDGGVKILDFYPGIDVEFMVYEGKVKANFILNNRLNFSDGWIVSRQGLGLSGGLKLNTAVAMKDEAGRLKGKIPVVNGGGEAVFEIGNCLIFDNNTDAQARLIAGAEITPANEFLIYVPVSWLNNPSLVYPVTIDPLVSASQSMAQAAITGSSYSAACYSGGCVYNMPSIVVPASCTVTDIKTTFTYNASNLCTMKDGGIILHYAACRAPSGTMAFTNPTSVSGNASINTSVYPYVLSCIPAPQCATYNMDFSMDFYRCNFDQTAGCNSNCISANSPWVVTVEGHTVEINSITPSHIVCTGGNTSLTATANYGVGPYAYSWAPGGAGQTISVSPGGSTVYVCTATDACGVTAVKNCSVTVTGSAAPSVTITPNGTVCAGTNITFTATANNGGSAPNYDWYLGAIFQQSGPTFTTTVSGLDSISVQLTSNSTCAFPTTAFAGFSIAPTPSSSVTLVSNPNTGPYCIGQTVVLTATPTNGGPVPVFGWGIGAAQSGIFLWTTGAANNTFSYTVQPGNKIFRVWLVSNLPCVINDTISSVTKSIAGTVPVTPNITISPSPVSACVGDVINFTTLISGGGTTPAYQWRLDGADIPGETNPTYTYTGAAPGTHTLSVVLTSNANCAVPTTDTAFVPVTISVLSAPSVSITPPAFGLCAGVPATFTATPVNGGATPSYQWQINGVNAGTDSSGFTTTALLGPNDSVSVTMTSSSACATSPTATNYVIYPVTTATPVVSITSIPLNPVNLCANDVVQFFTTTSGGGSAPTYQWQVNGVNVGTNSGSYSQAFSATSTVRVIFTSNAACASPVSDTDSVVVGIITPAVPTVSITQSPAGTFCAGTAVTFTPTPTPAGGSPAYQWFVNGTFAFIGTPFVTSTLSNGDVVKVRMTVTGCVNPDSAINQVVVSVTPSNPPTVNVTQSPTPQCQGSPVTFNASTTNGGTSPTFSWTLNGNPVVVPDSVFTSSSINPGDLIRVTLHSNVICPNPDTAFDIINAVITSTVIPTVSITQSPDPACLGTLVTFTATPVNGGAAPTYQWTLNGSNVGGSTSTYTNSTLVSGDVIGVTMTSNDPCPSTPTASNNLPANLLIPDVPIVTITPPPGDSVCQNATATFLATNTAFGGTSPAFQWFVNGTAVSSANPYSTTSLADGDIVRVVMTSNASCVAPVTDTDAVTMTVIPLVIPSVTLTASPNDSICESDPATFTTVIANGGSNPQYQWLNNGVVIPGQTNNTYSSSNLSNGNVIGVVLISDARCAVPASDTDRVAMTVSITVPSVTIAAVPSGSICTGTNITFTATPVNGGTAPVYEWFEGGNPVGTNLPTYASTTLTNGAQVTVRMTSNAYCASPQQANSSAFTANVVQYETPSVTITANPAGTICVGNPVTFTAVPVFGGPAPVFQWQVNGVNKGTNSNIYTASNLSDGDIVQVLLTSNYQCVTTPNAVSNQIVIDAAQPLQVSVSGGGVSVCPGDPVTLVANATGGLAPYGYSWTQNAGNDSAVIVSPLVTTTYIVSVSDICGSTVAKDTVVITVYPSPAANFSYSPQNPSNLAPEVTFTDLSYQAVTWLWNFGDNTSDPSQNPVHTFDSTGYFLVKLKVQNTFSCFDSVSYTILVKEEIAMYIPNSFTPDGDGLNDLFGPMGYELGPYSMIIYDRWGQIVFEGDEFTPWDGKLSDRKTYAPMGVYVYRIYFEDGKYNEPVVVGKITIAK